MPVHRIHLRGPWEYELLSSPSGESSAPSGRVTMPTDWRTLFGTANGRAVFRRRFHSPTNLEADDRVWIVFDGVEGRGTVTLNGSLLGDLKSSNTGQRYPMTAALHAFNELVVELTYDAAIDGQRGGLFAPVAIEIESSAEIS